MKQPRKLHSRDLYRPPDEIAPPPSPAKWMFDRLVWYIKRFEQNLDNEHEIGMRLVNFGSGASFHIEAIDCDEPDLFCFYGKDSNGQNVELIQNVSQLNVLLVAMKISSEKPPRRIGFELEKRRSSND